MKKILEIELRSDLCMGTGKGFAATVDTDTAIDEYGIPFIPAKRLKGVLREIASEVLELDEGRIARIFGVSGTAAGSMALTDARIKDYDCQLKAISTAIRSGKCKKNDVTDLFCSVRAATAIENDTVKDGSLRFVRVVNRISPVDREPLKFYADLSFEEQDCGDIERLFKALRQLGYHRNRGLGLVRCSLMDSVSDFQLPEKDFERDKNYRISYLLYLQGDLMLPAGDTGHSLDYIPGTAVLGTLAAKYTARYGEDNFNEYFFSPDVRFGNLTVSDEDGTLFLPAPGFLAKIKAADENQKGIYNRIAKEEEDCKKEIKPQYKPLKAGYINRERGYRLPKTEIIYHNAINTEEGREGSGLYTQSCISSGQYFSGSIEVTGAKAERVYSLLSDGALSFGRSRNAQYSHCRIQRVSVSEAEKKTVSLKKGKIAAYLCESDLVLARDGRFTVELPDFCEAVGLPVESLSPYSRLSAGIISGYNAKWNLKKPQFPAIKAGSCLVFSADRDQELPEITYLGEKQNEGFGKIRLIANAKDFTVSDKIPAEEEIIGDGATLLQAIQRQAEEDQLLEKAIQKSRNIRLNASQVGRITLMCKESDNFGAFSSRIESIKTTSTREEAKRHFAEEAIRAELGNDCNWASARRYIIKTLTAKKYQLRGEGK